MHDYNRVKLTLLLANSRHDGLLVLPEQPPRVGLLFFGLLPVNKISQASHIFLFLHLLSLFAFDVWFLLFLIL